MLILIPLGDPLIRLFVKEIDVVGEGIRCLHIISYGNVAFAVGMVTLQAFNGAGDTTTPVWLSFIALWVVKLPLAYILAHHSSWGAQGVYIAISVSYGILAALSAALFRRGQWKQRLL